MKDKANDAFLADAANHFDALREAAEQRDAFIDNLRSSLWKDHQGVQDALCEALEAYEYADVGKLLKQLRAYKNDPKGKFFDSHSEKTALTLAIILLDMTEEVLDYDADMIYENDFNKSFL